MILTVVDDGNHYSSPYSSYQLPTLRSRGTESTPGARCDNGLQIKPGPVLPTPPHNKSSSDIPMAMGGSLSSQDEVVEAIKVDLQAKKWVQLRLVNLSLIQESDELRLSRNIDTSEWINSTNCTIFCCRTDLSTIFDKFELHSATSPILDLTSMLNFKCCTSTCHRRVTTLV
jgi:hypothetical protein